jgi:hypothetical protein
LKQKQIWKRLDRALEPGDIVASFDPGESTGVCVARYNPQVVLRLEVLYSDVFPMARVDVLSLSLLRKWSPRVVVMERFVLYEDKAESQIGSQFPSVEVIGVLRAWCCVLKIPTIRQPAVVLARTGIPSEHRGLLKSPDEGEHARDAYGHARYFILDIHHHPPSKPGARS